MKRFSLLILSILFLFNPVFADLYSKQATPDYISKNLPALNSIECKFRQEKTLTNISKPVVSSGDFKFVKGEGVYFYTKYPVQTKADYTNKNYKQINSIIKAISAKKYSKLDFDFYYEGNISKWSLGMKPKKTSDAYTVLNSITIDGTDYINKITILQTNGNKTVIWFTK